MNKQDMAIVGGLFLVLLGWGFYQQKMAPPRPVPAPISGLAGTNDVMVSGTTALAQASSPAPAPPSADVPAPVSVDPLAAPVAVEPTFAQPEVRTVLTNERARITVSSWGGGVVSAELLSYEASPDGTNGNVFLDFEEGPALAIDGGGGTEFTVVSADGQHLELTAEVGDGVLLSRTLSMGDGYLIEVQDVYTNASGDVRVLPGHALGMGTMDSIKSKAKGRRMAYLGVDTLQVGDEEKVVHWGKKKLPSLFTEKAKAQYGKKVKADKMDARLENDLSAPVVWAAAKNKFFAQILSDDAGASAARLVAGRDLSSSNRLALGSVSAALVYGEKALAAGGSYTRQAEYFVGPKKYSFLKELSHDRAEIMEFGWLKPVCKVLLTTLNLIHSVLPNYGIAIIILTVIVRMLFWPITRKSTESMKRMQELQPEITAIRERLKAKPQKMNQEVMALYKEHKVNPMAGCLPIVVQIPVFIALFTVLRSAVELRYAGFLWIADLSEPEGLLAGSIPFVGSLNILPLFMSATMLWQQHLTPSTGDPQQKKIMMMMPVMMLFFFYSMPSALVLYWTVSQMLSILQLLLQKRKAA